MTDTTNTTPAAAENTPHPQAVAWKDYADGDLKEGRITAEQHAGIMADLGFSPEAPAAAAPDPVAEHLTAIGFAPAKESELRIRQHIAGPDVTMTAEQRADESTITGWLTESRLPAKIANALVDTVAKGAKTWAQMDEGQRELSAESARAHLSKMWGDKAGERIALAQALVREIDAKKPGLIQYLDATGGGNSVSLIAHLALHAERLKARHDGK